MLVFLKVNQLRYKSAFTARDSLIMGKIWEKEEKFNRLLEFSRSSIVCIKFHTFLEICSAHMLVFLVLLSYTTGVGNVY